MRLSQNEKDSCKKTATQEKKEAAEMSCALRYRESKYQAARAACNAAMCRTVSYFSNVFKQKPTTKRGHLF